MVTNEEDEEIALTIGELKEFIADLPNNALVLIDSVQRGDNSYGTETLDISYISGMDGNHLHLVPTEIEISPFDEE